MGAPSRRGFAVLFVVEVVVTGLFATALTIAGHTGAIAVVAAAFLAGWATTRFLAEVPQGVRAIVILAVIAGFIVLGVFADPVLAVGLAAMFAYYSGWFLTFLIAPGRARRWRAVTSGRRREGSPSGLDDRPPGERHR